VGKPGPVQGQTRRFSTWLYQIVTRRALNKVTRGRDAGSLDLLPDVADPGAEPAAQAERNLAVDAVTDAWPRCRSPSGQRSSCITSRDCRTPRSLA